VPLNTPVAYNETQAFARSLAQELEREHPERVVSEMAKVLRKNKVFIDWSQNADFKTTVGVYSLRAKRTSPFVSFPVRWEELRAALDAKSSGSLYFDPEGALQRLKRTGDLFEPVLSVKQSLPE